LNQYTTTHYILLLMLSEQISDVLICFFKSQKDNVDSKLASLLFVTWCSASKHWRGRKREKRGSSWSLKTL